MSITLIGNKEGVYIDPRNNNCICDYTKAENFREVNMYGVNHLVIRRRANGSMKIVQANGYNRIEGLFQRMY